MAPRPSFNHLATELGLHLLCVGHTQCHGQVTTIEMHARCETQHKSRTHSANTMRVLLVTRAMCIMQQAQARVNVRPLHCLAISAGALSGTNASAARLALPLWCTSRGVQNLPVAQEFPAAVLIHPRCSSTRRIRNTMNPQLSDPGNGHISQEKEPFDSVHLF